METVDDEFLKSSLGFMDKAKKDGKPFFVWHNTTRMHIFTFLSPKYQAMQNSETNYGLYEAGMAQLDDIVGDIMKKLRRYRARLTTPSWCSPPTTAPRRSPGRTAATRRSRAQKGTVYEGGFRVPVHRRWPGQIKPGTVENGMFSGLDWFPTFVAAAGDSDITDQAPEGREDRRPDVQEPPRRLQPAGHAAGQGAVRAA